MFPAVFITIYIIARFRHRAVGMPPQTIQRRFYAGMPTKVGRKSTAYGD